MNDTSVIRTDLAAPAMRSATPLSPPVDPNVRAHQAFLHGPVLTTMLRLAWPTILVLLAQVAVGAAETFYVSYLGTAALAGVALVFPILMLMTMMANGAVGGGVSSAVARAIGAGRLHDVNALVLHALVVAIGMGLAFTGIVLTCGRPLYTALGGTGAVLDAALIYSTFVFIGAVPSWIVSLMARRCAVPAMSRYRRLSPWSRRRFSLCCRRH